MFGFAVKITCNFHLGKGLNDWDQDDPTETVGIIGSREKFGWDDRIEEHSKDLPLKARL